MIPAKSSRRVRTCSLRNGYWLRRQAPTSRAARAAFHRDATVASPSISRGHKLATTCLILFANQATLFAFLFHFTTIFPSILSELGMCHPPFRSHCATKVDAKRGLCERICPIFRTGEALPSRLAWMASMVCLTQERPSKFLFCIWAARVGST